MKNTYKNDSDKQDVYSPQNESSTLLDNNSVSVGNILDDSINLGELTDLISRGNSILKYIDLDDLNSLLSQSQVVVGYIEDLEEFMRDLIYRDGGVTMHDIGGISMYMQNIPFFLNKEMISKMKKRDVMALVHVIHFLSSYYISQVSRSESKKFIEQQSATYNIKKIVDITSLTFRDIDITCTLPDFLNKGLEGDICIFIYNILKNAQSRGLADKVDIYYETNSSGNYLCIADNGMGINLAQFPDPNMIFQKGESGYGSSGIGLRDLEKRRIECSVSNEGLESKYKNLKSENKDSPLVANQKGALFKIKLDIVNPTV